MSVRSHGIRDLQARASEIVRDVEENGEPALITRHGKLAAVIVPVDDGALTDFAFAHVPSLRRSIEEADADIEAGRTTDLTDLLGG